MKHPSQLLLLSVLLTFSSVSYASLTNAWWYDDGDGALVCNTNLTGWASAESHLTMYGNQFAGPGNLWGQFSADGVTDPRATKTYYIDNNTGQTWLGYNVETYMDRAFSISNVVSSLPNDWHISIIQPTLNSHPLYYGSSEYVGYITLTAGTPVLDGQELDFSYDVGFAGSMNYRFEDTLSPMVPEPGVLSLLGMGACLLGSWACRRRRQNCQ